MKKKLFLLLSFVICINTNAQLQFSGSLSNDYLSNESTLIHKDLRLSNISFVTVNDSILDNMKQIKYNHKKMKSKKFNAVFFSILAGVTLIAGLSKRTKVYDSGDILVDTASTSLSKGIGNLLIGSSIISTGIAIPNYFSAAKYKRKRNKLIALEKEDKAVILEKLN